MRRIEALAMAIAREHEAFEPNSQAFETLNPGLLRPIPWINKNAPINENGIRKFDSFHSGWICLMNNLQVKCEGRTKAVGYDGILTPTSSLMDLAKTFKYLDVRRVVAFLKDALNDRAITELTKLNFFTEEPNAGRSSSRTDSHISASA